MRAMGAAAWLLLLSAPAAADELPTTLQVQLLAKTGSYITSLAPGETGAVKVLVVHPGASPSRNAEAVASGVNQTAQVGKFRAEAKLMPFSGLRAALAAEKPQLIWVAAEMDEKSVEGIIEACGTSPIVTVSPVAAHVRLGVILGFELVEAKPRILVHLKQAKVQNVVFLSGLLTHSVIVER